MLNLFLMYLPHCALIAFNFYFVGVLRTEECSFHI